MTGQEDVFQVPLRWSSLSTHQNHTQKACKISNFARSSITNRPVTAMNVDAFLIWFSNISLVVSLVILIWCGLTVAIKSRRDKEWLKTYVPTLGREISVTAIRSWLTLAEVEKRQADCATRSRRRPDGNSLVR